MNKAKRIELKKKYERKSPLGFQHIKENFFYCMKDNEGCRCKENYESELKSFESTHKLYPKYTKEPTKIPKSGHFGYCFNKETYSLAKDWKYLEELKQQNIKIIYLNHNNGPYSSIKVMKHFETLRTPLICIEVDIDDDRAVDSFSYFGSQYKRSYRVKYNRNRKRRKEECNSIIKGNIKNVNVETGIYDKSGHTNGRKGQWPNKWRQIYW